MPHFSFLVQNRFWNYAKNHIIEKNAFKIYVLHIIKQYLWPLISWSECSYAIIFPYAHYGQNNTPPLFCGPWLWLDSPPPPTLMPFNTAWRLKCYQSKTNYDGLHPRGVHLYIFDCSDRSSYVTLQSIYYTNNVSNH